MDWLKGSILKSFIEATEKREDNANLVWLSIWPLQAEGKSRKTDSKKSHQMESSVGRKLLTKFHKHDRNVSTWN